MFWKTTRFSEKVYEPHSLDPDLYHNFLVIIPAWNEETHVGKLVRELCDMGLDVLVVDDGSTDRTAEVAEQAGAKVLRHEQNRGKGESLADGYRFAGEDGYDAVVTIDADGQHDPADVPRFLDTYNRTGIPVLIGNRMHDRDRMPWIRRITNRVMSRVLNRHMQQYVPDTQNGFRLYQTDVVLMVIPETKGFAAESEILLKLDEIGIRMGAVPVAAFYGEERSHIRPIHDTRHFLMMLFRYARKKRVQA